MPFKNMLSPCRRLALCGALAAMLQAFVLLTSPVQAPVVLYKLALTTLAAVVGVFFDLAIFPYAAPESYLDDNWKNHPETHNLNNADFPIAQGYQMAFASACLRRTIIVTAFVLAVSLGL